MSANWEAIYRSYTDEELIEERAKLKKQLDSPYVSQSNGSKSYQRDVLMLQGKFKACVSVMVARGTATSGGQGLSGQVDFGQTTLDDF